MPELREQINLDGKEPSELEAIRRELTSKALTYQARNEELSDDDLYMLCAVTQSLRRRAVAPKERKAKSNGKKKASVADI